MLLYSAYRMFRSNDDHPPSTTPDLLATKLRLNSSYPTSAGMQSYAVEGVLPGFGLMFLAGVVSALLGIGSGVVKVLAMDRTMKLPFKSLHDDEQFHDRRNSRRERGVYLHRGPRVKPRLVVLLGASAMAFGESQGPARIAVGPNVLVSRDGDVSHVESAVAANPGDPLNLVATAITFTLPQGGYVNKTYATFDGGFSWYDARLPEERDLGSVDPKVAFTPRGTALQVGLGQGMSVYRSEDGGRNWLAPARLGRGLV